jgi:hypothetical protein
MPPFSAHCCAWNGKSKNFGAEQMNAKYSEIYPWDYVKNWADLENPKDIWIMYSPDLMEKCDSQLFARRGSLTIWLQFVKVWTTIVNCCCLQYVLMLLVVKNLNIHLLLSNFHCFFKSYQKLSLEDLRRQFWAWKHLLCMTLNKCSKPYLWFEHF